ncbi:cytochrome c oxidase subunit 7C, mitochondrial isoform X1 [Nasonia vitripennis]|uniref:Cytochrome c oxidase subunit 7C, mitochondrial n=1 Tax=Nasonia vitripennis TaxID=7425 RepID=A0A7M7TB82_NASVI|nr:cytochrome c oxidase subunit 7C, mitochondrial [Nasonia vitripennis]XP_031788689.1 cytochrome c oxidase subunit 7C, mitochondrial isoform X1 [Nasonia vitripennis]
MFCLQRISRNIIPKRNFMKSAIRKDEHDLGGEPGKNLPFDIHNRYKFTLIYTAFISIGMAIPFLAVRHQLLK